MLPAYYVSIKWEPLYDNRYWKLTSWLLLIVVYFMRCGVPASSILLFQTRDQSRTGVDGAFSNIVVTRIGKSWQKKQGQPKLLVSLKSTLLDSVPLHCYQRFGMGST